MGVLARIFEEHGLITTSISMVREHTAAVKPPRALYVPFPFGHPLGRPDDPEGQLQVMRAALALLERPAGPVLEDYPDDTYQDEDINLPQADDIVTRTADRDVAFEVTCLRGHYEQWLAAHDGRTGVGLTGVDQRRFRGLVRLLEAYAAGEEEPDLPERRPGVAQAQFVRWAADDIKAFYMEARMQQAPSASFQEVNTWLWADTALAPLLRAVRDRMASQAAADPPLQALSFGIAR